MIKSYVKYIKYIRFVWLHKSMFHDWFLAPHPKRFQSVFSTHWKRTCWTKRRNHIKSEVIWCLICSFVERNFGTMRWHNGKRFHKQFHSQWVKRKFSWLAWLADRCSFHKQYSLLWYIEWNKKILITYSFNLHFAR